MTDRQVAKLKKGENQLQDSNRYTILFFLRYREVEGRCNHLAKKLCPHFDDKNGIKEKLKFILSSRSYFLETIEL